VIREEEPPPPEVKKTAASKGLENLPLRC